MKIENEHTPVNCQLIANNCGKIKTESKVIKVKRQKSKGSPKPALDASQTSSDIILAQDNSTPCSEGTTLYKASLFGCKSNGTTLNTNSIQRAIDHIASQGGGTLVFEVGRYLTGSIHLRPGVNIQLNEGAILVASPNLHDYDTADGTPTLVIGSSDGQSRICGLGFVQASRPDVNLFSSDMKGTF